MTQLQHVENVHALPGQLIEVSYVGIADDVDVALLLDRQGNYRILLLVCVSRWRNDRLHKGLRFFHQRKGMEFTWRGYRRGLDRPNRLPWDGSPSTEAGLGHAKKRQ